MYIKMSGQDFVERKISITFKLPRCQYKNVIGKNKGKQCEKGCYKSHSYCSYHRYVLKKSKAVKYPRSAKKNSIAILK
jgi:hypothetical protein